MPDREKVIKGLYACTTFSENGATDGDCKICPYYKGYATGECWVQMNRDAIALLEKQNMQEECLLKKCVICPHCENCDVDENGLLEKQESTKQKAGEWIYCEDASGQDGYKCSECGFFEPWYYDFENHNFITEYQFCPSCGKPMQ